MPQILYELDEHMYELRRNFIYVPNERTTANETIFTKIFLVRRLFVSNSHTEFHENPIKGLVADMRLRRTDWKTEGRTDGRTRCPHKAVLFYFVKTSADLDGVSMVET